MIIGIVPGTQAVTIVMQRLAQQLASLRKQRDEVGVVVLSVQNLAL
ncbi:hypothetical protein SAMN05446635_0323 [Burkholderia sp. OK233]|nr:hypothetical protein SAMN05446635_0323 [Burkholderia sp. OK233]